MPSPSRFLFPLLAGALVVLTACGAPAQEPSGQASPAPATVTPPAAATATALPSPSPPAATETAPPPTATPKTETPPPPAATFPDPGQYTWNLVAAGLTRPLDLTHAGDGSGRLFVVEQPGVVRVILNGAVQAQPFLDIRERVGSGGNEQGLLGIAFHPRYPENGYFYVNYTDRGGDTVIARFQVSSDPQRADPGSETPLLRVPQPYGNHNGGAVVFGPDGFLYLGLGDGGSAGDPLGNGQALDTPLGKVLRLDVDGGDPYAIPPDNPFQPPDGLAEIWAYGLRNPWRMAFDSLTGDLYIGDVGQNVWEEINHLPGGAPGGANFGWDYREGAHAFEGTPPSGLQLVEPAAEYSHRVGGCSVTGGQVYRGAGLPEWQGIYLYGDYCSGLIWGLLPAGDGQFQEALLFDTGARIASFGLDESGELYLVDLGGAVYRLAGG